MEFRIERRAGLPTYLQIVQQTKQALRLGVLQPGDRLPTAKEVVAATAVNPNTVLEAHRELEREGLVEPRPGLGTFVRRSLAREDTAADGPLRAELNTWMARACSASFVPASRRRSALRATTRLPDARSCRTPAPVRVRFASSGAGPEV